jgi:hypothetical protein
MANLFLSYYSDEEADAQDIARHLEGTFQNEDLQVFMASRPDSVAPGDAWQDKVIDALGEADALLVLMTVNALSRPWINFEIGVAWARNARILLFCNRGMTPAALPTPYNTLQAVDINGLTFEAKLGRVTEVVSNALHIRPVGTIAPGSRPALSVSAEPIASTIRGWELRPLAHVGETATGEFLVGTVSPSRPDRANAAGFQPGEALFVRLFYGTTPEGRFINAMVGGEAASFFETVVRDTTIVSVFIRLAAVFEEGDTAIPLLVVDSSEEISPK